MEKPDGFDSINEYLALAGIPANLYYMAKAAGKDLKAFAEGYLTEWDAGDPITVLGIRFRNYHLMCNHLEDLGIIRKPSKRSEKVTVQSVYDRYAERDVLMWLAGNDRLSRPDALEQIARVVAPFRKDVDVSTDPRSRRHESFHDPKCVRCGFNTEDKLTTRIIRPKLASDPSFTVASRRRDFDPEKYEVWCRSCVSKSKKA